MSGGHLAGAERSRGKGRNENESKRDEMLVMFRLVPFHVDLLLGFKSLVSLDEVTVGCQVLD